MNKEALGEILILTSCILFSIMATLAKTVSASFSGTFIALFRFVSGITLGITLLVITSKPLRVNHKRSWILRGIFGSTSMILYFVAIRMTGSGRATLLGNTFPIFAALFGYLLFKESITTLQIVSLALCVLGVGLVFYDGSVVSMWGNLLGLSVGVVSGIAVHFIKKSTEADEPIIVYLATCLFGLVILPFTINEAINITPHSLLSLLLIGMLAFAVQILIGYGFRSVTATKASTITCTTIPLTALFGYCTGEELRPGFLLGTAIIIVGLLASSVATDRALAHLQMKLKDEV
jgi:drug/metabolite transporter (DMT)-like permease